MFTWTPEMIRLMQNANARSEYHRQLAAILAPKLAGCRTLCDAGCGLGSLSAALSPYFDAITAADVSDAALDVLRETIRTQNLTNITPLPCDLLQSTDRTRYDGMVFCFFGSLAEILPVARRQCAKTLVIIKKNYELHRFSLTAQPIRGETAPAACEALRAMGVPFRFDAQELEHGQPFASLDEAVQFFRIYSKDEAPGAVTPEAVLPRLQKTGKGDWIDLYAAQTMQLRAGDFALIPLGVSMQLPEGYEARTAPRSSTFRRWGILQANSVGVIDNSFCGTNDEWKLPVYATRDTVIEKGDRICQFRIFAVQPPVTFEECDTLSDTDRGGFGSTGVK